MQIFIKCLTGMSMTLSIEANDTIDNVKTKIQEQEAHWLIGMEDGDEIAKASSVMMKAGKLNLTYAGKLLENAKKVSDYNIQKGSELHMVFNTYGGGKRGSAEQGNGTKETITEDIVDSIGMLERVIGDVSGNPHMVGLLNRSQYIAGVADTGEEMVRGLNRDRLKRPKDGLDTTNVEYKAIAVKSHFFAQEVVTIKGFKNTIQSLEEHMTAVSKLVCVKSFSNPKGEVQWWQLKNIIDDQIATLDKMAGAAAAGAAMPEG